MASRAIISTAILIGIGIWIGYQFGAKDRTAIPPLVRTVVAAEQAPAVASTVATTGDDAPRTSPTVARDEPDFGLGDGHISKLLPYPPGGPGVRTPFDIWRYAGKGVSSWGSPDLGMPFAEW